MGYMSGELIGLKPECTVFWWWFASICPVLSSIFLRMYFLRTSHPQFRNAVLNVGCSWPQRFALWAKLQDVITPRIIHHFVQKSSQPPRMYFDRRVKSQTLDFDHHWCWFPSICPVEDDISKPFKYWGHSPRIEANHHQARKKTIICDLAILQPGVLWLCELFSEKMSITRIITAFSNFSRDDDHSRSKSSRYWDTSGLKMMFLKPLIIDHKDQEIETNRHQTKQGTMFWKLAILRNGMIGLENWGKFTSRKTENHCLTLNSSLDSYCRSLRAFGVRWQITRGVRAFCVWSERMIIPTINMATFRTRFRNWNCFFGEKAPLRKHHPSARFSNGTRKFFEREELPVCGEFEQNNGKPPRPR
jgi:hypothetical protein